MENLINRWKKIINNEKTTSGPKDVNNIKDNKDYFNSNSQDHTHRDNNSTNLASSMISERPNKFKNSTRSNFLRNNSENESKHNLLISGSNNRSNSSQAKSPKKKNDVSSTRSLSNSDPDKLVQLLTKTIHYIQKSQESCNLQKVIDNLNEAIEVYIQGVNNNKLVVKKFDEKEVIWRTKCDTAEMMIKDFELKVLTAEKEKTKLKKQIEELKDNLADIKEKNEFLQKSYDHISLLEKNNSILVKNNENLNDQVNEWKFKHECLIKKFEDEVRFIRERLDYYKANLNKVCNSVYEGNSFNL